MKPADKIKELIKKSDVRTSTETDERILADALKHLKKRRHQKSAGPRPNIWRYVTKGVVRKLGVAAAIIIAFGIGFFFGQRSKPAQPVIYSLDVTGYAPTISAYPTAPTSEDSFWRQKALAAMQPRPYAESRFDKTSLLNTYKQYLKEKHYD